MVTFLFASDDFKLFIAKGIDRVDKFIHIKVYPM